MAPSILRTALAGIARFGLLSTCLAAFAAQAALDFGGQSMGTTSPPLEFRYTNNTESTVTVTSVSLSGDGFAQSHDCGTVNPGASCTVTVTFTPPVAAGPVNSTQPANGTLTLTSTDPASPHTTSLAGVGEKSLVSHFYRSILRRAPDAGGKAHWSGEATRLAGLGANVNETWFAMAAAFYNSVEYGSFGRDDAGFVTDLYNTFFNRAPDSGGMQFWLSELQQGMPREVLLVSFMFSAEFQSFTRAIFGDVLSPADMDMVMDFYRGLLGRLPDSDGFTHWTGQFRSALCTPSGADRPTIERLAREMASGFINSPEYANRARGNAQFVGDLYNAVLRRGGDNSGVQYWIGQLAGGASRNAVLDQFLQSGEYSARLQAITTNGCPPPADCPALQPHYVGPIPGYTDLSNLRFQLRPARDAFPPQVGYKDFHYAGGSLSLSVIGATREETPPGTMAQYVISRCPGDFANAADNNAIESCTLWASPSGNAMFIGQGTACSLTPGSRYYLNLRFVQFQSTTPSCVSPPLGYCANWAKFN